MLSTPGQKIPSGGPRKASPEMKATMVEQKATAARVDQVVDFVQKITEL